MTTMFSQEKPSMEAVLEHHGVKGQKWGVRKEDSSGGGTSGTSQPSNHDQRRAAKIASFEARAAKTNVHISEIKKELNNLPPGMKGVYARSGLNQNLQSNTVYRERLLKDADAVRNGKMTSTQKKMLIGGLAVTALAGYVAYSQMSQSGQLNSLRLRGEAFMQGKKFDFAKDKSLAGKMSPDQVLSRVVKGINPNYTSPGGQMNCRRCTFAYELRRRGHDVVATPSSMGHGQSETGLINALTTSGRNRYSSTSLSSMVVRNSLGIRGQVPGDHRLNPGQLTSIPHAFSPKTIIDSLSTQPHGARGEIVFNFQRFGHSMAYENFNGKPVIFDTQKGIKYSGEAGLRKLIEKWGVPTNAEVTRLDNIPLDLAFLSRWATNK